MRDVLVTCLYVFAFSAMLLAGPPGACAEGPLPPGRSFQYTPELTEATEKWKNLEIAYEGWAKDADLSVALDQHLYKALLPLIRKYASENNLDIAVKEGTCGISSGLLSRKAVDLAALCCSPASYDRLPGLTYHTVAMGAIGIVVHRENPIGNLTQSEVRNLFSGRISRWSDLRSSKGMKGLEIPVKPIGRLHCKTRPGHWRLILDNEDLFGDDLEEVGTIPDMVRSVASYRGSIGHLRTWNVHVYSHRWQVKAVTVDGISPDDREALLKAEYPFYAVYNIASWKIGGKENPLAQKLLRYIIENLSEVDSRFVVISPEELRRAGWKFAGDELIGTPDGK